VVRIQPDKGAANLEIGDAAGERERERDRDARPPRRGPAGYSVDGISAGWQRAPPPLGGSRHTPPIDFVVAPPSDVNVNGNGT
jgi:hypothetical protein